MATLCSFVSNDFLQGSTVVRKLGAGTYGSVYLVRTKTGQEYAVKYMGAGNGLPPEALLDVDALVRLRHDPDIIHLIGVCYDRTGIANIAIILEAMDSNLSAFIKTTPDQIRAEIFPRLFRSLARVASLLETLNISHFDIKPQNILVKGQGRSAQFKVTDFGLSRALYLSRRPPLHEVFTIWYRPPEFLVRRDRTSFNITAGDIWSIGLTLVEFVTGAPLFPGRNSYIVLERIYTQVFIVQNPSLKISFVDFLRRLQDGTITGRVEIVDPRIAPGLQTLLSRMLSLNPRDRPSGTEILSHFHLRIASDHLLTLLDVEAPRQIDSDSIDLLLQTASSLRLSRATQVVAIELFTRYLSITSSSIDLPSYALAALWIAAKYNEDLVISVSQVGGPIVIEFERLLLQAVGYQTYNSNLTAVIQRIYQRNLDPATYLATHFANRLDDWFMT